MTRTLRNEIARALIDNRQWTLTHMRQALLDAETAVETLRAVALVHGINALVEAL